MTDKDLQSMFKTCFNIPKIELHAHLGGSIRPNTFMELCEAQGVDTDHIDFYKVDLAEAFKIFPICDKIVNTLDILRRITVEMIEDYAKHQTIYLEIRSGPKEIDGKTKQEYVDTILGAIEECEKTVPSITVRYLISLNRARTVEANTENWELCKTNFEKSKFVVGLDYSGDPRKGHFNDFKPIFDEAKELSIPVSFHLGECDHLDDETEQILNYGPARLGHCIFCSDEHLRQIAESQIPVEACIASNLCTTQKTTVSSLTHLSTLHKHGAVLVPCCDDTMLMNTNMVSEYFEFVKITKVNQKGLKEMVVKAVDAVFDNDVKEKLRDNIESFQVE